MMLEDIDKDQAEKDITTLEKKLSETKDKVEQIRFTKQLEMAKAKLNAATGTITA